MTIALDASGDLFIADLGNNRVQEVTCGFADKTTYAYDAYGNLTSETDPLGRTTTATYDPLGDLLTETSPMGNVTANTYDADQELTSSTAGYGSAAAATTTYTYDGSGNVLTTVTPRGNVAGGTPSDFTTTNAYDALGDLVSVTDPYGHSTTYAYDAAGNKLSMRDRDSNLTTYAYDAVGELVSETAGSGSAAASTSSFAYDADGNKIAYTDGAGDTTSYAYNVDDQLTSTTDPLGHVTSTTYDNVGNEATLTNPDAKTTTYTYNADNQVQGVAYSDGTTPGVSLTYSANGQLATMTDGSGTSSYSYDYAGEPLTYENGAGATVGYSYDANGNVAALTYPGARTATESHDALGRLTSVTDWLGNTTSFAYDANSNLTATTYPNGVTSASTFDNVDRVTQMTDTLGSSTLAQFSYGYDNASLLTSETDTGTPNAGTTSYSYNTLHELTAAGSATYAYSPARNLTSGPGGTTQAFNSAGELCWATRTGSGACSSPPSGATSYAYSAEGNLTHVTPTTGTSTTFGWNEQNALTSVTPSTGSATSYSYDGNGLLQSETTPSATTELTWNIVGSLPALLSDATNDYLYGPSATPVEQVALSSGTPSYLLADHLGSVRAITSSTGAVTASFTYDAWGNANGTSGSATTPFRYAGGYLDPSSGLYYYRARWYDAATGQFMSLDPAVASTLAPYSYVGNDPVAGTDPSGDFRIGVHVPIVVSQAIALAFETSAEADSILSAAGSFSLVISSIMAAAGVSATYIGTEFEACVTVYAAETVLHGTQADPSCYAFAVGTFKWNEIWNADLYVFAGVDYESRPSKGRPPLSGHDVAAGAGTSPAGVGTLSGANAVAQLNSGQPAIAQVSVSETDPLTYNPRTGYSGTAISSGGETVSVSGGGVTTAANLLAYLVYVSDPTSANLRALVDSVGK